MKLYILMLVIKQQCPHIAESMSILINLSLTTGVVPLNLKYAKVCPIFKEGLHNDFGNYRPISILPSFSKICERVFFITDSTDILLSSMSFQIVSLASEKILQHIWLN